MSSTRNRQLLKDYLQHKNSGPEKEIVDNWYQQLDDADPISMDAKKEAQVKEQIWASIAPGIKTHKEAIKIRLSWLRAAAILTTIGSLALLFWKTPVPGKSTKDNCPGGCFTTVSTQTGERKNVTLPDGTNLMLNSVSTIRISPDFPAKRIVQLIDGEVFFDVKHDPKHPFIIKSGRLTTQVLGTAFNIRAYSQLGKMTIGVLRGKVGVRIDNQPSHFLIKGQQIAYQRNDQTIQLTPLDEQNMAWQKGNLVLNNASFEEMSILMAKNFGIQVYTNNQNLKTKHFTTTISTSAPALKAMEIVAAIHQLKIKKRRNDIEIY
ncbi:ferric-dicitrate binding protein FerR (iron transport regulator) [Pedobacter cryoconitis]|uniref:Ferric-dicitrate binding protein FerR (Iron transport regulator) n=1 Tax=Pedobacter cryoconitis TaxID=188932 RepID=A0A7W8YXH1_9SPHI|nr:FecR family protein [Pedobacter cryoconitis]MBB5623570.1 ferric-dicitrate binding protein FerR (iron transport regulator) [Pedobacter cryoconitis]